MENFMKIDENFVTDFLTKVMRGTISSKEKEMLKKNPRLAKKVKDLRKINKELEKDVKALGKKGF
jgi:hypothetical protein|tara:strand:+ start:53 stop:247 length:195 start_codon:yes stop_codon:yes gene_type:complete